MGEFERESLLTDETERELKELANQLFSRPTIPATELIRREDLRLELEKRLEALGFGLEVNTRLNLALVYGLPEFEDEEAEDMEWVSGTMKAIIVALFVHLHLPQEAAYRQPAGPANTPSIDANTIKKLLPNLTNGQINQALPRLKRYDYLEGARPPYRPGPRLMALPGAARIKEALSNEEFFYSFELHQKQQDQPTDDYSEHPV